MVKRAALAALFLGSSYALVTPAQRLLPTVVPEHYDIHLSPDFATDTFGGSVTIRVRLAEPTQAISLHAAEIEFHEATVTAAGRTQTAAVSLSPESETATLSVPASMPAGPATIAIRYTGLLNDKLRGFYRSTANGREYAITQLEATDARRAFPSFDEPAFKATFAMSATIDARDTAISNGRLLSDTPGPAAGKHTLKFSTTARMSPYLVALVVGDWECLAGVADRIPIRVCGTPDRKNELGFALEAAEFALEYFNRYFTIKYPFEKLDIIAVPDFAAGAMENTGAIVFRDQFLLVGQDGGSLEHRKQIAQYIAHEIAHHWFGDLVTMQWWDDIWLNEGFATWMERRPMEEWSPEWNVRLDEVHDTQAAMNLDALEATRPIRMRVETPAEINEVFDAIAYQKTAAVIRMVEGYVGPTDYRQAINAYLKKFAYANATGEGFWATVAAVTKKPVDRILRSYITQSSMPLLTITQSCSGSSTQLSLTQRPVSSAVPPSTTWEIPICLKRARDGRIDRPACTVLTERSSSMKLDGCSSWVFANVDGRGYYRTAYRSDDVKLLADAIGNNQLTAVEQMSLVEDVWALVLVNQQNIADFLSLAAVLARRGSPATPADRINLISDRLISDAQRPAFQQWVRQTFHPLLDTLGWAPVRNENPERQSLRSDVLYTLGSAGNDPDVLAEARRGAEGHLGAGARLHPSVAGTILNLAAMDGDASLYDRYLAGMAGNNSRDDQIRFRNALTYFRDPELTQRTLDYATSSDVRSQDAPEIIGQVMARPWSAARAWGHLKHNWSRLQQALGVFQGLPTVVGSTASFCDPASREDVVRFLKEHPISGTERTMRQAVETIDRCIATRNEQSKNVAGFLAR